MRVLDDLYLFRCLRNLSLIAVSRGRQHAESIVAVNILLHVERHLDDAAVSLGGLGQVLLSGQEILARHPFLQKHPVGIAVIAVLQAQGLQSLMVLVEATHLEFHKCTGSRVHHIIINMQGYTA